jgi:hypothetical protein
MIAPMKPRKPQPPAATSGAQKKAVGDTRKDTQGRVLRAQQRFIQSRMGGY